MLRTARRLVRLERGGLRGQEHSAELERKMGPSEQAGRDQCEAGRQRHIMAYLLK